MGAIWLGDMREDTSSHFTIVVSLRISVVGLVATGGSAGVEGWEDA